ncbi:MAG: membrane integrity-associated transporter subunit PqiC [Hyphomicrobiales bacterium]|nr:membrane integrity-associated transporter subunit PqiC [Hyphomicrobiales bacterium]
MNDRQHHRGTIRPARTAASARVPVALALAGVALLGGCATSAEPARIYDLGTSQDVPARPLRHAVDVSLPVAIQPYDSDRLVIRTGPDTIAYLEGSQWVDGLPRLLQARLREALENAGAGARPHAGLSKETLKINIRRFEVDVTRGQAIVSLSVRLVATASDRVIAGRIIRATAPSPDHGGAAMAAALNAATGKALRQIIMLAASSR